MAYSATYLWLPYTAGSVQAVVGESTWTGDAGDGDYDNTDNWSTASEPNTGSSVRITASDTELSANLVKTTIKYKMLAFGPGFTGGMANPLEVNAGTLVINAGTDLELDGEFDDIYILDTNGWTVTLDGTCTNLYILAGNVTVSDDMTLYNLYVTPSSGKLATVTVGVDVFGDLQTANAAGPDLMRIHNGSHVTTQSGTYALEIYGKAECRFSVDSGGNDAMDNLEIHSGSKVWHDTDGKITGMTMYGGSFTFDDNDEATHNMTNATIYDGTMDLRTGKGSLNLTGSITFYGGTIRADENVTLSI